MLVISRKYGEGIVIGQGADAIHVIVLRDSGNRVRLAIDAPKEIPIVRPPKKKVDSEDTAE